MCAFSKRFYHPALNLANNQFCGLPKFNMTKTAILWTSFQPYVPRITSVVWNKQRPWVSEITVYEDKTM